LRSEAADVIDLSDRCALVTGAGRGIGRAVAVALAAHGCRVALNDITAERLSETAGIIERAGGEAFLVAGDVASSRDVAATITATREAFGEIDVLVNNAGVISALLVEDITDEEWDRIIRVNLTGVFYMCRAIVPAMKERRAGRIINIASNAAKTGEALLTHYSASKFGVLGFSQALALELAPHHVNVNCVCPVWCDTNMMADMAPVYAAYEGRSPDELIALWREQNPWGRTAVPTDVAKACVFLASDYAEFITGQGLNVSGGEEVH
jgi:NAD(P)-dependent dehydrogenase (short-subunit alcohol dehydrogenase family)